MEQDTFETMVANRNVQKFVATYVANALALAQVPSLAEVNAALTRHGLPSIVIWDSLVTIEGKDGRQVVESGWEAGNVAFSESDQL